MNFTSDSNGHGIDSFLEASELINSMQETMRASSKDKENADITKGESKTKSNHFEI